MKKHTVYRNGIHYGGIWYFHPELCRYIGTEVYAVKNGNNLAVETLDGHLICQATPDFAE